MITALDVAAVPESADREPGTPGSPTVRGRTPVSVLVPTLNEAADLPGCLESLSFADEVVVVDSGSTDATAA